MCDLLPPLSHKFSSEDWLPYSVPPQISWLRGLLVQAVPGVTQVHCSV